MKDKNNYIKENKELLQSSVKENSRWEDSSLIFIDENEDSPNIPIR